MARFSEARDALCPIKLQFSDSRVLCGQLEQVDVSNQHDAYDGTVIVERSAVDRCPAVVVI